MDRRGQKSHLSSKDREAGPVPKREPVAQRKARQGREEVEEESKLGPEPSPRCQLTSLTIAQWPWWTDCTLFLAEPGESLRSSPWAWHPIHPLN